MSSQTNLTGGCACGANRFTLTREPLIVQACHCRDCQRLSGSAFSVNLWIENAYVKKDTPALKSHEMTGGSGAPHEVSFCEHCGTTLWSKYHAAPGDALFIRVGALDNPEGIKPAVHVYTRSKHHWVNLDEDDRAFDEFYNPKEEWSAESLERLTTMMGKSPKS